MTLTYGFYNSLDGDRQYDAVQLSSIFDGIVTDGIFQSVGTAFAVTATTGMVVSIGAGRAWFNHTWTYNSTAMTLTVDQAEVALNRIDTVVIKVDTTNAVRANSVYIKKGTPATNPVPPTLTNAGGVYEYPLADIAVDATVTEILTADITNRIGVTNGTPFITGILETINTAWLFAQWDDEFHTWFDNLVDELTTEQAANLQAQIDALGPHPRDYKNLLINGSFAVAQRATSVASISGSSLYRTVDRWKLGLSGAGIWTMEQLFDTAIKATNVKLTCTTSSGALPASAFFILEQSIESRMLQSALKGDAAAKSLTLSFQVKSSVAGTYIVSLTDEQNTRRISRSYVVSSANAWIPKTITFPGDTVGALLDDSSAGLTLRFWFAAGTNYTSSPLQTSWGATTTAASATGQLNLGAVGGDFIQLAQVQLEVGSVATEYWREPFDITLSRCQRYFQKSYSYSGAIGGASSNGLGWGVATGIGAMRCESVFNHIMRATPTVVIYARDGVQDKVSLGSSLTTEVGTIVTASASNDRCINSLSDSGNGFTAGTVYCFHWTADAEF